MRKFIFIALAVLLVLSFATLTFAEEPQIKLGGRILVRGWNFNGVDLDSTSETAFMPCEDANAASLLTTNIYLTVDAKVSDNVQGFLELESTNNDTGTSGLYTWGSYDQKPNADLQFRQAWIQYTGSGLLGVPSGIKVGHQLLTLGEKQFLNLERFGTDAIMVFTQPTKELFLGAITAKLAENGAQIATPGRQSYIDNTDDIDAYILLGTYKLDKDNTIGLNYTYANCSDVDLAFSNVGAHANGLLMGALSYAAEVDFQFGDVWENPSSDFGGWAAMLKLGYKLNPVNLRASFAMGSGDDDYYDDSADEFQVVTSTDLVSPLARFVHYTQIYERTIRTAAIDQELNGADRSTGIANTTYFNLGLDYSPMKDLSLSLDGFYLMATETGAWEDLYGDVDDDLGWEVDFKGSYQITKNLAYFVEAAWFDPGDFYTDIDPFADESVIQLVHGLNLTF